MNEQTVKIKPMAMLGSVILHNISGSLGKFGAFLESSADS